MLAPHTNDQENNRKFKKGEANFQLLNMFEIWYE